RPCAPRTSDRSLAAHERATACDAGRSPDAATSRPSCREPHNPRRRTPRRRTGSHAENPRTNRADHSRPQTRCTSPSTATSTQGPTGKDRCLAYPRDTVDPNRSLPKPTQKSVLPTPFSEEPDRATPSLARAAVCSRADGGATPPRLGSFAAGLQGRALAKRSLPGDVGPRKSPPAFDGRPEQNPQPNTRSPRPQASERPNFGFVSCAGPPRRQIMTIRVTPENARAAVLDAAHIGDIQGAFGTILDGDVAPCKTWKGRLTTLLAILGPGLIVMVGDND